MMGKYLFSILSLNRIALISFAVLAILSLTVGLGVSQDKWWPSKYGADDVIGAANEITPEKVVEAARLIKKGKIYDLQLTLVPEGPAFPPRYYQFQLMYNNIHPSRWLGSNQFAWSDEIIAGNLGTFTQVDCLGHAGIGEIFYNGRKWGEIATPAGLTSNSCEMSPQEMTRGVLIDIAAYKGVPVLSDDYVITVKDIQGALKKQGNMEVRPGDIVVFHTGWIQSYWLKDNKRYISSEPGPSTAAAQWLVDKRVTGVGADNWGVEAFPVKGSDEMFTLHQELITKNGIYILENVVSEHLAKDKVYEFAFVMTFLKARGAGQTWGTFIGVN
ncbi:cyclase family protein [Desulfobacterota bacterium AH_259_B03_O07]|nr:cyclase family protein [Desulfobacterota bacterium AH_259_B03_O07]